MAVQSVLREWLSAPNSLPSGNFAAGRIPIESIEDARVREAVLYWRELAKGRDFPAREDIRPSAIARLSRNVLPLRVKRAPKAIVRHSDQASSDCNYPPWGEWRTCSIVRQVGNRILWDDQ